MLILGAVVLITLLDNKQDTPQLLINRETPTVPTGQPQVLVDDLQIPWAIDFLPNGNLLVTERVGTLKEIAADGNIVKSLGIADVSPIGEGGLMGVAVHPNFEKNNFVYIMYTYNEGGPKNKIVRFLYKDSNLSEDKTIIDSIPGSSNHNGGRLKFGPDGFLYATTGDAQNPQSSQDRDSLSGKILRLMDDGANAPGNPFNTAVYSYGHRNPEGLAWDKDGRLWATEHGSSAKDEVNQIEAGKNYGWPDVTGDQTRDGIQAPKVNSGNSTWAPGDLAFAGDKFYFTGLRGQSVFVMNPKNPKEIKQLFNGEFGRLREIVLGPDGKIYITTSNRDGRGIPKEGDDKIIVLPSSILARI